jgi:amino acid transporter
MPSESTNEQSHSLKKELRLRDLVLMQILLVVGISWSGIAAHQGSSHIWFWILGIFAIFIPQAMVIQYCAQIWPLEGGVYQWTKFAFGPFAAFMGAWNFAIWALLAVSNLGIFWASSLSYAIGPGADWMADNKWMISGLNIVLFGFILLVSLPGFHIGKWVAHFGSVVTVIIAVLLSLLLFYHPTATHLHPHHSPQAPIGFAFPVITLLSLNLFSKVCNSALSGLEQVAVFAGETKNPGKVIMQSAWIGAPITALLYIMMTAALLAYTPADQIDLAAPVSQVLAAAFSGGSGAGAFWAQQLGRLAIFGLACAVVAQYALLVAETARLPLVVGWDKLIPAWFTELHPKYKTPTRSIIFIVVCAVVICMLSLLGTGHEEALQLINSSSNTMYGVYYVLFFAVPLAAATRVSLKHLPRPGLGLKIATTSGTLAVLLGIVFALRPIIEVPNKFLFGMKVGLATLILNIVGALLYWRGVQNQKIPAA